ncbi:MAG TPA: hypothetical protein VGI56_13830 [Galbitalea sp.]|jgi:uncharacterized protein YciI
MYIFATGTVTKPGEIGPYLDDEHAAMEQLKADGVILNAFRFAEHTGVVSFLEAETIESASELIKRLPFVEHGLMEFEFSEVVDV